MQCEINQFFSGPWGVAQKRRLEIESAAFGKAEKIIQEEIEKLFVPLDACAVKFGRTPRTAFIHLAAGNARYIKHRGRNYYFLEDVERIAAEYKAKQNEPAPAKKAGGRRK